MRCDAERNKAKRLVLAWPPPADETIERGRRLLWFALLGFAWLSRYGAIAAALLKEAGKSAPEYVEKREKKVNQPQAQAVSVVSLVYLRVLEAHVGVRRIVRARR